jgi:hypothetical protein
MKTAARAAILAIILALLPGCERHSLSIADRQLSKRIKRTFGVSLPCSLSRAGMWMHGPIGGLVIDAKGESLKWAWGRPGHGVGVPRRTRGERMRGDWARVKAHLDSALRNPPTLAYVGAEDFRAPDARPLSVGSSAESLLIQLLWYVVGADTIYTAPLEPGVSKRLYAARAARGLERQRAGKTPFPLRISETDSL